MKVHVITLFPEQVDGYLGHGILGRAVKAGLLEVNSIYLREFAFDRHRVVDDGPYGGGEGLVLKPEPMSRAIEAAREVCSAGAKTPVVLTSPHGKLLDAATARELSLMPEWIVICGQYGGLDDRIRQLHVTHEISIGDYVLNGGELPALAMIEAAARFVPGVLGNEDSANQDTFEDGLLGAPRYTRPPEFEGLKIPKVLLSGHHAQIEKWKRERKLENTKKNRPDLLEKAALNEKDIRFLKDLDRNEENKEKQES